MNKEKFETLMQTESNIQALKRIIELEKEILSLCKVDKELFDNEQKSGVDKFE